MDGMGIALIATAGAAAAYTWWRRRRNERLQSASVSVRCPQHDVHARIAVVTDPAARAGRRYLAVASCSLLSDAAVALPERTGYLADGPPCGMRLEPARGVVYTGEVACRQPCVEILNATAASATTRPLACTSGFSDAYGLAEQALGPSRMARLLWYASL